MSHIITQRNSSECSAKIAQCYCEKLEQYLTREQMDSLMNGDGLVPGDFCDDNMLMAECFVDLGYAEDVDSLAADDEMVATVWNQAWLEAVTMNFIPRST